MRVLFVLFVLLVDFVALIRLTPILGRSVVLVWVALTFFIGITIVRLAGTNALRNVSRQLDAGRLPGKTLLSGALQVLGGALLVFPGFITDLCAFFLLFNPFHRLIASLISAWFSRRLGIRPQPEADPDEFNYTIGPDGRPIRDVDVEVHTDPSGQENK